MIWRELALGFRGKGVKLVGIVTKPANPLTTGVVVVVGGPQYRVGSHRQFVLLARRLASEGYPVLRFDHSGMGDSSGAPSNFENLQKDIDAAVGALLQACPGVRRIVLWGLCDGASATLLYLHETADRRVAGLVLLNPWIRTATTQASTRVRHYYLKRLTEWAFWTKLFGGRLAEGALRGFFGSVGSAVKSRSPDAASAAGYPQRMAKAWLEFRGEVMLLLSDHDFTAREFEAYCNSDALWQRAQRERPALRVDLLQADHTCSQPLAERAMHEATLELLALLERT